MSDLNLDSGIVSLCAVVQIWKNGFNIDIDRSNDTVCLPYIIYNKPADPATSISENNKNDYEVYYFDHTLNIHSYSSKSNLVNLRIHDMDGRIIKEITVNRNTPDEFKINLTNLSSGLYIVNLTNEVGKMSNYKFVVK